jgi:hypothetical protein
MRKRLMTIAGVLIAVAVVASGVVVLLTGGEDDVDRATLAGALRLAPGDTQRFSWTDWAGVRRAVDLDLSQSSPGSAVEDLLDRGFEADLTPSSALGSSAAVMQQRLGFSPATLDWELFSQGAGSASLTMRASASVDFDFVEAQLLETGYAEPAEADGAWFSDPLTDDITSQVTPVLIYVALDREQRMIFASDTDVGVAAAVAAAEDASSEVLTDDVVAAVGDPLSASLYTGEQVCNALALARADATDVEQGQALIAAAGPVNPLLGFAIGAYADGGVRVVMALETAEQARTNAETRAVLATGPAPGQGGEFADRFTLESATASGELVVLELEPQPGAYVLSDLSSGPLLFATC